MQNKSSNTEECNSCIDKRIDESIFEQICDTIFTLIPQVPRLKQLFLNWSELDQDERAQLDTKVRTWYCPNRQQLYRSLKEALSRWENVQDTQGAPGCEPGLVCFSCDPQLEEELGSLVHSLETLFLRKYESERFDRRFGSYAEYARETLLQSSNVENYYRFISSPKDRILHSVHSCGCILDSKNSDDDLSGYLTN